MSQGRDRRILEGPLGLELARFGTPLALGMALQTTFNLVDAYLIAQLPHGELGPAVGAIGICDQVTALGTIVSYGVSMAAGAVISRRKGEGDDDGIRRAVWQSILLVGALSVVFGLFFGLGAGVVVRDVLGVKGAVADVATSYLRVSAGGAFSIYFLLQLTNVQRALGSAKTPVALLVLGNVLNVLLAVVFIFGPGPAPPWLSWATPIARALHVPRMGMVGAAWAAVLARTAVLLPNVVILARRFDVFPAKGGRRPDRAELRLIAAIAWPSSAQFCLRIGAMLFLNSLVARAFTTDADQTATTAMGLVFRLDTMALFVAMGWGSAAQTFVGQNLGAGKLTRARDSGWWTTVFDAITNAGLIALIFGYGEAILRIFDDEPGPVQVAFAYLRIVAPSYLTLGIGIVLGNAMAGAGATKTTFAVDAFLILLVEVPLCVVATLLFPGSLEAVFRAVAITNVVGAVLYAVVYLRGSWVRALAEGPSELARAHVTPEG